MTVLTGKATAMACALANRKRTAFFSVRVERGDGIDEFPRDRAGRRGDQEDGQDSVAALQAGARGYLPRRVTAASHT